MNIFFKEQHYQGSGQACLVDLVPPTFAGIASLVAQESGALLASWLAASDVSLPIRYRVYIQAGTSSGLFNSANRLLESEGGLSALLYRDALGARLVRGVQYFVGVRAVDAVGNESANLQSLSAISEGVVDENCESLAQKVVEMLRASDGTLVGEIFENEDFLEGIVSDETEHLEGVVRECD